MKLTEVKWINLSSHADDRGLLTAVEGGQDIPFEIRRVFYMHKIDPKLERGGHAHTDTDQVIIPVYGSFKVDLSDGISTQSYVLDDATRGLYQPRMIWARLYDFCQGAVCLVLSSTHYEKSKSLRTWDDFIDYIKRQK